MERQATADAAGPADPEETREALRAHAVRSTYFMAKAIVGFADLTVRTHGPMADFIDAAPRRKFGLVPRDHLKTSVWTIADVVRRIAANANIRILIANETATNAAKMLRRIQSVFERNEKFRWLFPEVIPDLAKTRKWSETEMLVPRSEDYPESTVEAIGVGGAVVSRHYDVIKLDDLVGKEASESDEVMRKTIDWYQYCDPLLDNPSKGEIHVYGTRWSYRDLYAWIDEHETRISKFHRSCYLPDGSALWPERFPLEVLDDLRSKIGDFKFSCQFENCPFDPEGASLKREWLRFYRIVDDEAVPEVGPSAPLGRLFTTMRLDPAVGDSSRSARSAIVVDGVDPLGRKFVLETWAQRAQPSTVIDEMFRLHSKWRPQAVGIESVAYQKALKYFVADEFARRGVHINVVELKPDSKQSKEARIRGLQPFFQRGEIFLLKEQEDLLVEYASFPMGTTVDILDALAYGPAMWELPLPEGEDEDNAETWNEESTWLGRSTVTGY